MTLCVRATGASAAPAIVLLHSIATSSAMWEPQVAIWGERFKVLAIDLPGHGGSPPLAAGADLRHYADAVAATLLEHRVGAAAIVGLSFGSMIAQRLAIDRPDLVRAAILANGVAYAPENVRSAWRERIVAVEAGGMAGQIAPTLQRWFTPDFLGDAPLTVARIGRLIGATPPTGYIDAANAICGLDHRDRLSRIGCPTFVLAGQNDAAAPPEAVKSLAEAIPSARYAALPAAHLTNVELPALFTEMVGAFLVETVLA